MLLRTVSPVSLQPLTVIVDGVENASVVMAIECAVRAVFNETGVRGQWVVAVAPSDTKGRWDAAIKGPRGRHMMAFPATVRDVADVTARHVRRHLSRVATP